MSELKTNLKRKYVYLRVKPDIRNQIAEIAEREERTLAAVADRILREALSNYAPTSPKEGET